MSLFFKLMHPVLCVSSRYSFSLKAQSAQMPQLELSGDSRSVRFQGSAKNYLPRMQQGDPIAVLKSI